MIYVTGDTHANIDIEKLNENDPMVSFLERIRQDLHFKRWYFGHYHVDKQLNDQFVALYNRVIPISDMQMWRNR